MSSWLAAQRLGMSRYLDISGDLFVVYLHLHVLLLFWKIPPMLFTGNDSIVYIVVYCIFLDWPNYVQCYQI